MNRKGISKTVVAVVIVLIIVIASVSII